MRDAIVKVRLTTEEKDILFGFSERSGTTVSDLVRKATREICSRKPIDRATREDLVVLRRLLNAALDAPTEASFASVKQAVAHVLGRLP